MEHPLKDTASSPASVSPHEPRRGIFGPPPRIVRPERIDAADLRREDAAATLRDIARVNRFLGGTRALLSALAPLFADAAAAKSTETAPIRLLDIGTGSADIPRAIARAASQGRLPGVRHRAVMIRATDHNPRMLEVARKWTPRATYPGIETEEADALALPYPDGAFDIALCSLTLHHFNPSEAAQVLREMERVTTTGFVVNDLLRSRAAAFGVRLWLFATAASPLSRHDGPLSVMRAYTPGEYRAIAAEAGIPGIIVRRAPIARVLLLRRKRN